MIFMTSIVIDTIEKTIIDYYYIPRLCCLGTRQFDILKVKHWPVGKLINIEDIFNVSFIVRIKRAQV